MLQYSIAHTEPTIIPSRATGDPDAPALAVNHVSYTYTHKRGAGENIVALNDVSFEVRRGELFCLLGPNGSGKSTLFKILSTLIPSQRGSISLLGADIAHGQNMIRRNIGVVFQHPSLDVKLTAKENLIHQGHLYGIRGVELRSRVEEMLSNVGLADRANSLVETLSGGMQRRIELAKSLLHKPQFLILDEPSTGLDPGARRDFSNYLRTLCSNDGVTILLTTHILDEASHCDTIAILDRGTLVATGTPDRLTREIGGEVITVSTPDPITLQTSIERVFGGSPVVIDNKVRIERIDAHEFLPQIVKAFPGLIDAVTLSKPTLEDVFIHKTGRTFWSEDQIQ